MCGWCLRAVSQKDWWGAERAPRQYAEALWALRDSPERQRGFMLNVPEHLHDLVRDHYRTALALGGKK